MREEAAAALQSMSAEVDRLKGQLAKARKGILEGEEASRQVEASKTQLMKVHEDFARQVAGGARTRTYLSTCLLTDSLPCFALACLLALAWYRRQRSVNKPRGRGSSV